MSYTRKRLKIQSSGLCYQIIQLTYLLTRKLYIERPRIYNIKFYMYRSCFIVKLRYWLVRYKTEII